MRSGELALYSEFVSGGSLCLVMIKRTLAWGLLLVLLTIFCYMAFRDDPANRKAYHTNKIKSPRS